MYTYFENSLMIFSGTLNIICDLEDSCFGSSFYCPTPNENCNIDCLASDSCYTTNLYVPYEKYRGLNLNCDDNVNDTCDSVNIHCVDTGDSSFMAYDTMNSYWNCQSFGCCPFKEGNVTCDAGTDCMVWSNYIYYFLYIFCAKSHK